MYSSGLNIEVQGALLQVAALSKTLNWEPLQVETSVQSELRSRLDPRSTMILIKMLIVGNLIRGGISSYSFLRKCINTFNIWMHNKRKYVLAIE